MHVFIIPLVYKSVFVSGSLHAFKILRVTQVYNKYVQYYTQNTRQSRVEITDCAVVYFDHIAVFEVLHRSASIKGGAHICFVDA